MNKKHWTDKDFVITETDNAGEYGYCAKCTADMQRFNSDNLIRHYNSHGYYRKYQKGLK